MDNFSEKKHVLVVSKEPRVLAEIKMELMKDYEVSIAATSTAVISILKTQKTAVILIHIGENRENSFSLYGEISDVAKGMKVPVIFLAEKGNDDDETTAFMKGAVDYTVRRRGTINALHSRINLRIHANESEKSITNEPIPAEKVILVVDDVELNREVVRVMLADVSSLILDFAVDGQDAVEKFIKKPNRYSLILMDIQMPIMSGTEATMKIRSSNHERGQEIPIVAMTAGVSDDEVAQYFSSGMNDYIQKPMDYARLLDLITEYCWTKHL